MRPFYSTFVALILLACTSCSSTEYRYVPTGTEAGVDQFQGEATFPIPGKDSAGNVRITSLGIAELKPKDDGKRVDALHLRVVLSNQGTTDWRIHIPDQTVAFPNHAGVSAPIYANSDSLLLADIAIPPKSLRTVDLFYALPSGWHEAKDLPEFDFHWKIRGNGEPLENSVSFARLELPEYVVSNYPYPYGPYTGLGYGEWWWGPSSGPYTNYYR